MRCSHQPWRFWRPDWIRPWVSWSIWQLFLFWVGSWTRNLLRSLPIGMSLNLEYFVELPWGDGITQILALAMSVMWAEQTAASLKVYYKIIVMLYNSSVSSVCGLFCGTPQTWYLSSLYRWLCCDRCAWELEGLVVFPAFQEGGRSAVIEVKFLMGINECVSLLSKEILSL